VFMLVHSIASLPFGLMADKYSRRKVIASGVGFWSLTSLASGLAPNFTSLLAIRGLVGVGESSYAPAATAMISENFPHQSRAMAQGMFNIGMFIGGTLGAMIGGVIAFHTSWRYAFFIVSIPGFFFAWLAGRLTDKRPASYSTEAKISFWELLKNPAFAWIIISGIFLTFAVGAYISWGVEFVRRYKGYNLQQASLILGGTMMAAGVIGTYLGSYVGDRLQKKYKSGRSLTVALSLIVSSPLMYLGLHDDHSKLLFLSLFFIGTVFLSFYHGPATAVIHDVVPVHMRATAFAIYVLIIHLLGDAPAPAVVGRISDITAGGLRTGLEIVTAFVFVSGLCFLVVCYMVEKGKAKIYTE
jgi:MFS family permease